MERREAKPSQPVPGRSPLWRWGRREASAIKEFARIAFLFYIKADSRDGQAEGYLWNKPPSLV